MSRLCAHTAAAADSPVSWIHFSGAGPGEVRLPTVRLGSSRGYSFTVWLRISDALAGASGWASQPGSTFAAAPAGGDRGLQSPTQATPSLSNGFKSVMRGVWKKESSVAQGEEAAAEPAASPAFTLRLETSGEAVLSGGVPPGTAAKGASGGTGVEVLLVPLPTADAPHQYHAILQANNAGVPPLAALDPAAALTLVPSQWHCLCVTHSQPYLKRARARVFLNGVPVLSADLPFPSARELDACVVTVNAPGECFLWRVCVSESCTFVTSAFLCCACVHACVIV